MEPGCIIDMNLIFQHHRATFQMKNEPIILDINYVDFLQFQRYFTPQAELEEAFIYIIHKPIDFSIDFSCRLKT